LNPTLARQRAVILAGLISITVLAWVWVLWQANAGMPMKTPGLSLTMGMGVWPFLLMWTVMMIGMMFPASAPMILTFATIQARNRARDLPYVPVSVFTGAYMLVWVAFGVAALIMAAALDAMAQQSAWLVSGWPRISGGLILAAGIYQFTPYKNICLRHCRSPMGFLMQHWKDGRIGAFSMGLRHGLYCAGCCWLLFVILVPLGLMNLAAMGAVTVLVFAEKTLPHSDRIAVAGGVILVSLGLIVLLFPGTWPHLVG
jgi:predicted metal-binding membrane protein